VDEEWNVDDMSRLATMERLRDGMRVIDADGVQVGTIGLIHFGDPSAVEVSPEPSQVSGSVFATDLVRSEPRVPEPLRGSLLQIGFVRVDEKLHLRPDHHFYVVPQQIVAIEGDTVSLGLSKGELIQPS
jgi:hypothetical protein